MSDPVVLAWGDMLYAPHDARAKANADAAALVPCDVILGLGDISNDDGSADDYVRVTAALAAVKALMRPCPGNHDYADTFPLATAYFAYFGAAAGTAGKGWYSFDLANNWHIIALNAVSEAGIGVARATEQGAWLAADLAANVGKHIIAFWHQPATTSGYFGGQEDTWKINGTFWQQLYEARAEIILNGHLHVYERFARMDWNGNADPTGVRQFTVGTGGAGSVGAGEQPTPDNLEVVARTDTDPALAWEDYGYLKLTLGTDRYTYEFVPVAGTFTDSGVTLTHGKRRAITGRASSVGRSASPGRTPAERAAL